MDIQKKKMINNDLNRMILKKFEYGHTKQDHYFTKRSLFALAIVVLKHKGYNLFLRWRW